MSTRIGVKIEENEQVKKSAPAPMPEPVEAVSEETIETEKVKKPRTVTKRAAKKTR